MLFSSKKFFTDLKSISLYQKYVRPEIEKVVSYMQVTTAFV